MAPPPIDPLEPSIAPRQFAPLVIKVPNKLVFVLIYETEGHRDGDVSGGGGGGIGDGLGDGLGDGSTIGGGSGVAEGVAGGDGYAYADTGIGEGKENIKGVKGRVCCELVPDSGGRPNAAL